MGSQRVRHDLAIEQQNTVHVGFPRGSDSKKKSACSAGDLSSIPGSGRSPGEGNDYPLQFSCLDDSMDKEALRAVVHEVTRVRHD